MARPRTISTYTSGLLPLDEERRKSMKFLEETNNLYIYGMYRGNKLLYRESFMKFEIDGVPNLPRPRKPSERWIW